MFDPEPAEGVAAFNDPILQAANLCGTHHIGASTAQAQNAIADEAMRVIETFIKTGVVLNCVNLARRTPAKWQLVVRHHDRVGVLAFVMDHIRRAGLNIEEVQNVVFDGALAASCRIQLSGRPPDTLLSTIQNGNPDIIGLQDPAANRLGLLSHQFNRNDANELRKSRNGDRIYRMNRIKCGMGWSSPNGEPSFVLHSILPSCQSCSSCQDSVF